MKPKKGRPKLSKQHARGNILSMRLLPNERRSMDSAAEKAEMKITAWARKRLLECAERDNS